MPRPAHWPSSEELEARREGWTLPPFPKNLEWAYIRQTEDGSWQEEKVIYLIDRRRTPAEELTPLKDCYKLLDKEVGRRFRIAEAHETADEIVLDPNSLEEEIRLVEVSS